VFAAAILLGAAGSVLGPAVVAISLGLVGQDGLGQRLGRNQRFASIGGLVAAAIMGIVGYALSARDILFVTAAFGLPAIWALASINHEDIHFARACSSADHHVTPPPRVSRAILFKDRRLVTFAACLFLFQFANASILPLVGETLVHADGRWSTIVMSVLIVVPQVIVALFAPWVGRTASTWGRRPLLLIGLGMVPIRATLFALTTDPGLLFVFQVLDGITAATLGVLTALVIADLAQGTGRFNLAQGLMGAVSGIGASLSTSLSGLIVSKFGQMAGFLSIASIGLMAVMVLWLFMPETKPAIVQRKAG
jgi:predicted MFS family arabinose efflux permease